MHRILKILTVLILSFSMISYSTNAYSDTNADTKFNKSMSSKNKVFYGKWLIKKAIVYGKITEYGYSDIKKIIGKTITYQKNKVIYGKHILKNPDYKITNESENDFFMGTI